MSVQGQYIREIVYGADVRIPPNFPLHRAELHARRTFGNIYDCHWGFRHTHKHPPWSLECFLPPRLLSSHVVIH